MYNKTNLIIGIDTIAITIYKNIVNEDNIRPLRQLFKENHLTKRITIDNYEYIVMNKEGMSIATISNYYDNNSDINTIVTLHGMKQVFCYKELQREHILILNWLSRYNNVSIKLIDTSYDNLNGYDKTIIIENNQTNISEQNKHNIHYTSGFRTHHIYIPIDNNELIDKIKSKIIDKERIKYKIAELNEKGNKKIIKGNYYQFINKEILNEEGNILIHPKYNIIKDKDYSSHVDFIITNQKSYFIYLQIIKDYIEELEEDYKIEINYKEPETYSNNIFIKKPQSADKAYLYDKEKRDLDNENKELYMGLFQREQSKRYKTTSKKIRLTRYENRKVFNQKDTTISHEDNNINEVFNLILNEIIKKVKTVKIYIFKTKEDVAKYKEYYNTHKKLIPLNKVAFRQLQINSKDIEKSLNIIKKHLTYNNTIEEPIIKTMTSNEIDFFNQIDSNKNKSIVDKNMIKTMIKKYGIKYIEEIRKY